MSRELRAVLAFYPRVGRWRLMLTWRDVQACLGAGSLASLSAARLILGVLGELDDVELVRFLRDPERLVALLNPSRSRASVPKNSSSVSE